MSSYEIVQDVLLESRERELFTGVPRRLQYRLKKGKAFTCIGVRRCGKSTFLNQLMSDILRKGVSREDILYVNFFDDRLEEVRRGRLDLLTEVFSGLYPREKKRPIYYFLDEIQMADHWEPFVDRLLRTGPSEVYLTGSSSRMLSREVATAMRGRALTWELFPFSFTEFLDARSIKPDVRGSKARSRIRNAFDEFWIKGGFPEVLEENERERVMIHQDYFKTMIFRDVVDRHDALHPRAVKDMAYRLLNAAASMYSVNALTGYLKSLGHRTSKTFVGDVLDWLEDAYALFTVRIYDSSLNRQQANPKKIYGIDHALIRSTSTGILLNRGHLLENMVFIAHRRLGRELYYYRTRSGREIDFVWRRRDGTLEFIQVAETAPNDSSIRERELSALREALQEHPESTAILVTKDDERETISLDNGVVESIPVWRYLLEEEIGS